MVSASQGCSLYIILGKMVRDKEQSAPCLQDEQKHERPMANRLPEAAQNQSTSAAGQAPERQESKIQPRRLRSSKPNVIATSSALCHPSPPLWTHALYQHPFERVTPNGILGPQLRADSMLLIIRENLASSLSSYLLSTDTWMLPVILTRRPSLQPCSAPQD